MIFEKKCYLIQSATIYLPRYSISRGVRAPAAREFGELDEKIITGRTPYALFGLGSSIRKC